MNYHNIFFGQRDAPAMLTERMREEGVSGDNVLTRNAMHASREDCNR